MVKPVRVLELNTVPAELNVLTRVPLRLRAMRHPTSVSADDRS